MKKIIILLLFATVISGATGCAANIKAADLMISITPQPVIGKSADDVFIENMADFSMKLFKKSLNDKENSLISPLSVMLALAMTANGADRETLVQMEKLLGGGIPLDELNEYLFKYVKGLPNESKSKLSIANSVWLRENSEADQDFLQKNADYYGAAAYKAAFDDGTIKDINKWIKTNTDGMIGNILNEINPNSVMYLINAIVFDAEWKMR